MKQWCLKKENSQVYLCFSFLLLSSILDCICISFIKFLQNVKILTVWKVMATFSFWNLHLKHKSIVNAWCIASLNTLYRKYYFFKHQKLIYITTVYCSKFCDLKLAETFWNSKKSTSIFFKNDYCNFHHF